MRRAQVLLVLAGLALAACDCGAAALAGRYGDLNVVEVDGAGRELLRRDATVTLPGGAMGEATAGAVPVRNVGQEGVTIERVTHLEGDGVFTLDDAAGLVVGAGADATLAVTFAPPQALDATVAELAHRDRFALQLRGARAGEELLLLELVATAFARDCFVPARLDFGRVPLQQAIALSVRLDNAREGPVTASRSALTGADPAAFFVDGEQTTPLAPHESAAYSVRFSPLEERAYSARLEVQRAEGCPRATVELLGEGDAEALSWSPSRLDFGRLPLGVTATRQVTLVNGSNAPLTLTGSLTGGDFSAGTVPTTLPAGGALTVDVSCTPTELGPRAGELTLELGTFPPTPARIQLGCIGGGPRIRVDPNPLQFGQVPWSTANSVSDPNAVRRRLVVQNVGTAPPAPGDPAHNLFLGRAGAAPWFSIVPGNADTRADEFSVSLRGAYSPDAGLAAVAGQNFVEFDVVVAARSAHRKDAALWVYSNDAKEPVVKVPLVALPRAPEQCSFRVSDEALDFGALPRGVTTSKSVTIENLGASGQACLVSGIDLAPGSDPAYLVTSPVVSSLLIPGGASATIRVSASVPPTATLDQYLRGTLRFRVGTTPALTEVPLHLQVARCLVVDPLAIDFGLVKEGCVSAPRPVTLYNTCGATVSLAGLSTNPPFRLTSAVGTPTLPPAQNLTVQVVLAPTSTGTWSDALAVTWSEGGATSTGGTALAGRSDPAGVMTEAFSQSSAETDILFIIDDSCSMGDEQMALATNFSAFISAATAGVVDWHLGVTTTDTFAVRGRLISAPGNPAVLTRNLPNVQQLFRDKVQVGTSGSGLEQPFEAMALALTEPTLSSFNAGFLRADAALAVIIVTDAVEQSASPTGAYLAKLTQAKGGRSDLVSLSVVGPFGAAMGCSTEGIDSGRYDSLINATNGVRTDICTVDWARDLETISRTVFASRRAFRLTGTPRGAADIDVTVNGAATSLWRYDAASNSVIFTQAPAPNAAISITYVTACF